MMSQDLQLLFASTLQLHAIVDGMKYIVKFCSKIGGDEHWFSIVLSRRMQIEIMESGGNNSVRGGGALSSK
jgi:hypothetical protein